VASEKENEIGRFFSAFVLARSSRVAGQVLGEKSILNLSKLLDRTKGKERVKGQGDLITSLILYFEAVALATMLSFALAYLGAVPVEIKRTRSPPLNGAIPEFLGKKRSFWAKRGY
jgi:hypothetical protein